MKKLAMVPILALVVAVFAPAASAERPLLQDEPGGSACQPGNPELGEPLTKGHFPEDGPPNPQQWFELSFDSGTRTIDLSVFHPGDIFGPHVVEVFLWDGTECGEQIQLTRASMVWQGPWRGVLHGGVTVVEPISPGQYQVKVSATHGGNGSDWIVTNTPGL